MSYTKGPWEVVDAITTKRGVRAENGYICFLTDVQKYPGQEQRYIEELQEREDNAALIASAPSIKAENASLRQEMDRFATALKQIGHYRVIEGEWDDDFYTNHGPAEVADAALNNFDIRHDILDEGGE